MQASRNIGTVKAAQRGGHIRQQRRRHQIASTHPHGSRNQCQTQQFQRLHHNQSPQRHPQRPQGTDHATTLFKRQPDRAMHHKNTHRKRQQTKGRQIKMKTAGQSGNICACLRGRQLQMRRNLRQRHLYQRLLWIDHQPCQPSINVQQLLRHSNIHHSRIRGQQRTGFKTG